MIKNQRGFTLIELFVGVTIVLILSAIVMFNILKYQKESRDARRFEDLRTLQSAIDLYYIDNGSYPDIHDAISSPGSSKWAELSNKLKPYIAKLPTDPLNSGTRYYYYNGVHTLCCLSDPPGYGIMSVLESNKYGPKALNDGGYWNVFFSNSYNFYEIGPWPAYDAAQSPRQNWWD